MQKHKILFGSSSIPNTWGDVQHCLRVNDLDEVGDGTHYLDFHMLGLFSIQQWTVPQGIEFWMGFCHLIGVIPDTVTIPPHQPQWRHFYQQYDVIVHEDPQCVWSDGNIGGDCTEFYKNGVEIGNIVHPLGRHLDCGFGGERLERFVSPQPSPSRSDVLGRTIWVLLQEGIQPSNTQQGYVLRKLLRECFLQQYPLPDHKSVRIEWEKWQKLMRNVPKLLHKHPNHTEQFFWETYGVSPQVLRMFRR